MNYSGRRKDSFKIKYHYSRHPPIFFGDDHFDAVFERISLHNLPLAQQYINGRFNYADSKWPVHEVFNLMMTVAGRESNLTISTGGLLGQEYGNNPLEVVYSLKR